MTKKDFVLQLVREMACAYIVRDERTSFYPDPGWLISKAEETARVLERAGYFETV